MDRFAAVRFQRGEGLGQGNEFITVLFGISPKRGKGRRFEFPVRQLGVAVEVATPLDHVVVEPLGLGVDVRVPVVAIGSKRAAGKDHQ